MCYKIFVYLPYLGFKKVLTGIITAISLLIKRYYHIKSLNEELEQASDFHLKLNVTIANSYCCSECDKLTDIIIPLEEVIQAPLLPYHKCIKPSGCTCMYSFEAIRDEKGRIQYKDSKQSNRTG